jgi:hypothetical protein
VLKKWGLGLENPMYWRKERIVPMFLVERSYGRNFATQSEN